MRNINNADFEDQYPEIATSIVTRTKPRLKSRFILKKDKK